MTAQIEQRIAKLERKTGGFGDVIIVVGNGAGEPSDRGFEDRLALARQRGGPNGTVYIIDTGISR